MEKVCGYCDVNYAKLETFILYIFPQNAKVAWHGRYYSEGYFKAKTFN